MQKRAREYHGPTHRRFEAARPILGETDLASLEIRVEVDRGRKPAVGRAGRVSAQSGAMCCATLIGSKR
jgi:hypothetical protein